MESDKKSRYQKPSTDVLKKKLSQLQFEVTQKDKTEAPFKNEYWDNKEKGIYVDITTGEPLFASIHKYESGTGWPSFDRPISDSHVKFKDDRKMIFMKRTEVRSNVGDAHLGHVFDDGPDSTGKRYCMNSAAMRFIPFNEMDKEGYSELKSLFDEGAHE